MITDYKITLIYTLLILMPYQKLNSILWCKNTTIELAYAVGVVVGFIVGATLGAVVGLEVGHLPTDVVL